MIQFNVLSGRMAGARTVARRFPFHLGRDSAADLQLDDPGVWDRHARVDFKAGEGFALVAVGDALITVNNQPVRETVLHNGDHVSLGSVRLSFWLAETRQRGLRFRESLVWACALGITLLQVGLLYWLLR